MHMADALLSPAIGGVFWLASASTLAYCARRVRLAPTNEQLVPLMGVLGAFVFAAMMINFTIPGTGSSGHIGGALLLSILLGPQAAFIVLASVLTVQALFFADGGLLALGANMFNLGVLPCFVGYLLVYRPLVGANPLAVSPRRHGAITLLAALIGSQLGALGVVFETTASGISSLPLTSFLLLMQPIHLAIGIVEGLATAAIVLFVRRARPDLFNPGQSLSRCTLRPLLIGLGVVAALTAGLFSCFVSAQPDGLEWSLRQVTGSTTLAAPGNPVHSGLAQLQKKLAWLADYQWPGSDAQAHPGAALQTRLSTAEWPAVEAGGSLAGLIGAVGTLVLVLGVGAILRRRRVP